jgi:hypothetical protein
MNNTSRPLRRGWTHLTRRQLLKAAGVAGVAGMSGWTALSGHGPMVLRLAAAAATPKMGGRLTVGLLVAPNHLDPRRVPNQPGR